jgi:hypothetical protein
MNAIPTQAGLYTQHLDFLFHSSVFMFFVSYLYGYGISFIFGTKKTFTISFFIVIITAILILMFTSSYVFYTQCFATPDSHCFALETAIGSFFAWLTILTANFFINIIVGTAAVGIGILLYFPSEIIMEKYFGISFKSEEPQNYDYVPATTTGTKTGVNAFLQQGNHPSPTPPPTAPVVQEQKPLMPPPTR